MMTEKDVYKGTCHYCGREDVWICSTPEIEGMCADCYKLVIANCREAVKALNDAGRKNKKIKLEENLEELKADAEMAIKNLIDFRAD